MAFGDNNDKKYYEPIVYSNYAMSNTDGVDPSALNFSFSGGLLKIQIAPMLPNAKSTDKNLWDKDNTAFISITHTKARMLADDIRYMREHLDEIHNVGVPSGKEGSIFFSDGKELGATSPCLIIRKINADTGELTATYAYQFKADYHYSIRNFDYAEKDFTKHYFPDLEIDQFLAVLDTYYTNMSGAVAYGVLRGAKYDIQREHTKTKLIMDKLGIESTGEYSKGGGYNNRSFFSGNNSGSSSGYMNPPTGMRDATIEDITS